MNDKDELGNKQKVKSIGDKSKMPETPDFTEWGREPRKGDPFALSDWAGGSPANTAKP
jgi:hypothetical protein